MWGRTTGHVTLNVDTVRTASITMAAIVDPTFTRGAAVIEASEVIVSASALCSGSARSRVSDDHPTPTRSR